MKKPLRASIRFVATILLGMPNRSLTRSFRSLVPW